MTLPLELQEKLNNLAHALIDQKKARVIVPAQDQSTGFWFGGGNMIESAEGDLYLVGRYRNFGDSRTGIGAGERGLELSIFQSSDQGDSFEKILKWSKADLNVGETPVLSIEGSALRWTDQGVELLVSTEKDNIGYPQEVEGFLKPGTGVWTIDSIKADSVERLKNASVTPFLSSQEPNWLHVKDPFVYSNPQSGSTVFCCTHPFNWASSNTAFVDPEGTLVSDFFPRGMSWDVAMTRGTALLDVPMVGAFEEIDATLVFYDGGECVRDLDQHKEAVTRPRGYSCEELGGLAFFSDGDLSQIHRISRHFPSFISPYGTGCSRYVDVFPTSRGLIATWQQSQDDGSQPLVMNILSNAEVESILA
ncbi:hypothetical protein KOR42_17430 [Thalassoglobus neptunius]|uniref:Exo-alpha-sialidase n=1 Tax=Thalassoglobus neptunius TaxID=1938619 RepID=A0A5C5X6U1_9PLAN|nr:exo-alpha-sialidase [Thalassoglobus neptunius]TWT58369.1 hypothetical protein KOR42_17430 [Thalassoglobus neptunius]